MKYWTKEEITQLKEKACLEAYEVWLSLFVEITECFFEKTEDEYEKIRNIWKGKISLWIYPFIGYLESFIEKELNIFGIKKEGELIWSLNQPFHSVVFYISQKINPDWRNFESCKELFLQYPMVARGLTLYTQVIKEAYIVLLKRIHQDKSKIEETFFDKKQISYNSIQLLETDIHGDKTGIFKITSSEGTFVYKTRSLGAYKILNDMIQNCCQNLHQVLYLDKENYGYVEYLEDEGIDFSKADKLLHCLGEFLAVIVVWNTSDLHSDNIVYKNNSPVLIDAETLITPKTKTDKNINEFGTLLNRGVLMVFSAINNPNFQGEADGFLLLAIKQVLEKGIFSKEQCISHFLSGFEKTVKQMITMQKYWHGRIQSGVYDRVKFRFLMRNSQTYHMLWASSCNFQRAVDKSLFKQNIERLKRGFLQYGEESEYTRIGDCEVSELLNGNIPIYFVKFTETCIYMDELPICKDFLIKTPAKEFLDGIKNLESEQTYNAYKNMIKKCLEILLQPEETEKGLETALVSRSVRENEVERISLENRVHTIFRALVDKRIETEHHEVYWMQKRRHGFYISEMDYFDGIVGIARFLAAYESIYKVKEAQEVFEFIGNNCFRFYKERYEMTNGKVPFSLMHGLAGIIRVFDEMKDEEVNVLLSMLPETGLEKGLDLYDGIAGILYAVASCKESVKTAKLTERYGKQLLYALYCQDISKLDDSFAHGKAGIAYALSVAYQRTGDEDYIQMAVKLLENCKIPQKEEIFGMCRGMIGIAYSAACIPKQYQTDIIKNFIEAGVERCKGFYIKNQDSLCCGNTGLAVFAQRLFSITKETDYLLYAKEILVKNSKKNKTLGFFTGIAGEGYEILAILYPDSIKEVW